MLFKRERINSHIFLFFLQNIAAQKASSYGIFSYSQCMETSTHSQCYHCNERFCQTHEILHRNQIEREYYYIHRRQTPYKELMSNPVFCFIVSLINFVIFFYIFDENPLSMTFSDPRTISKNDAISALNSCSTLKMCPSKNVDSIFQ
jgi:hypothetical protein